MKGKIKYAIFGILIIIIALFSSKNISSAEEATFKLKPGKIAEPDFYTFYQDGTYNTNIFCAQRDTRFTKGWVCYYHVAAWQENAGIFKNQASFNSMTWLVNNFFERSKSTTNLGNQLTYEQKAKLLSSSGTKITADEVKSVFGNQTEKFKLYQEIIWTYTNGKAAIPNSDLSGSTLKIYNALKKLADKCEAGNIKITADKSPKYTNGKWVWSNFNIINTYPLPYQLSVKVDGKSYSSSKVSYDASKKTLSISGLDNNRKHTFDVTAETYTVKSKVKIWLNDDINDGYDGVESQPFIEIDDTKKEKKSVSISAEVEGVVEGYYNIEVWKKEDLDDIFSKAIKGASFSIDGSAPKTTNSVGAVILKQKVPIKKENLNKEISVKIKEESVPDLYVGMDKEIEIILKAGIKKNSNGQDYYYIRNVKFADSGEEETTVTLKNGKVAKVRLNLSSEKPNEIEEKKTTVTLEVENPPKQYDLALTKSIILPNSVSAEKYDLNLNGEVDVMDAAFGARLIKAFMNNKLTLTGNNESNGKKLIEMIKEADTTSDNSVYNKYKEMSPTEVFDKFDIRKTGNISAGTIGMIVAKITPICSGGEDRINGINSSRLNKILQDENGKDYLVTTANYNMNKVTFGVNKTDIITYKITVYNEGDYAAKDIQITDYLPEGLVICDKDGKTVGDGQTITCTNNNASFKQETTWKVNGKTATTTVNTKLDPYTSNSLNRANVYINCKIEDSVNVGTVLYNVAEITKSTPVDSTGKAITDLTDRDSTEGSLSKVTDIVEKYKNRFEGKENKNELDSSNVYKSEYEYEDDDDFERIVVKEKIFDLALRKSITKVGKSEDNMTELKDNANRLPQITMYTVIDCTKNGTGSYEHKKEHVEVEKNDFVEYSIRVYNEGSQTDYSGYASEITDYLPGGLEFYAIVNKDGRWITQETDGKYVTEQNKFGNYEAKYDKTNNSVTINCVNAPTLNTKANLADLLGLEDSQLEGYYNAGSTDTINNNVYGYQEVKIICKVLDNAPTGKNLTNIAEITKSVATEGDSQNVAEGIQDKDSKAKSVTIGESMNISNSSQQVDLKSYYQYKAVDDIRNKYYAGIEDDDDFETVIVPQDQIQIAVQKQWDDQENIDNLRPTSIEVKLNANGTTYTAEGVQNPVTLNEENGWYYKWDNLPQKIDGTNVTYTIEETITIEGYTALYEIRQIDGVKTFVITNTHTPEDTERSVEKVWNDDNDRDKIRPESIQVQLNANGNKYEAEGVQNPVTLNKENEWEYTWNELPTKIGGKNVTYEIIEIGEIKGYTTASTVEGNKTIITNTHTPEDTERSVEKVWNDDNNADKIRPESIQVQLNANGNKYEAEGVTNPVTLNEANGWKYTWNNLPTKIDEKDVTYEIVEIGEIKGYTSASTVNGNKTTITNTHTPESDLALRKFITKVNDKEITDRIPNVDITPLVDRTSTTATYNHPKDPVLVAQNQLVTYTIRVYNEGPTDAYASLVKDDIPQGLEFVTYTEGDGSTNDTYKWKLVDENDNEVTEPSKAKYVVTDYLAKDAEEKNLLKGFNPETMTELDYRDVQIQFKVIEPNTSDRIVINQAQIADDSDSNGNSMTDKDSTPNEWKGEDDEDIEKIRVLYFDLALRKWVTQAIVTENGQTQVTETGHKAEDDPEEVVKVDLKKSKISNVIVKFRYSIRITNEGEIAGEAQEISDYIPEGLVFIAEDNPDWRQEEGKVVTEKLKGKTLQPGESAEVEILLTWVNSESNMGVMVNTAEISKDYNEYGSPDIDSTPNNKVPGEDDIDDAPVMLTVKTGSEIIMIVTLGLGVIAIIGAGVEIIRKKVIRN